MAGFSNSNDFNKDTQLKKTNRYDADVAARAMMARSNYGQGPQIANNDVAYGSSPMDTAWNLGRIGQGFYKMGAARRNDGIFDGHRLLGARPNGMNDAQWVQSIKANPEGWGWGMDSNGWFMGTSENMPQIGTLTSNLAQGSSIIGDSSIVSSPSIVSSVANAPINIGGITSTTAGTAGTAAATGAEAAAGAGAAADGSVSAASAGLNPAFAIAGGVILGDQLFNKGRGLREIGRGLRKIF